MKRALVIAVPLLIVVAAFFVVSTWKPAPPEKIEVLANKAPSPAQTNSQPDFAQGPTPPNPHATVEEGRADSETVARMITSFHTRMKENPVGTNAEITKALMGGNPVHATFAPETPRINSKGELIDPWGTPYFFHQLSGDHMETISAGPDKIMGTADDIIEN